ncbi:Thiamine pyrophosphokinase 1 [Pseudocercospora fuligena]|uniref:Thiamine pyrophosphokinase n=1 Tax=Pseudocercospora fuligena TaxID=685502 RepID=A0A8H6R7J6_9PEZI|nr:Thiamine pyrophosphokinase 1 [Pseudocercospora fuligena]
MAIQNGTTGHTSRIRLTKYLESDPAHTSASPEVALVILNSPIEDLEYFRRLFDHASYRICVDGGANRVHDLLLKHYPSSQYHEALAHALPSAIHGDLDSIREDVRLKYEELGVPITHDPDQYSTDFGKAVKTIAAKMPQVRDVLVLGSLGGRVDHGIGLLHEIYRQQKYHHPELRFWFFSEASVTILLRPGTTEIVTPLKDGLITPNIGILPLYGKAVISIEGCEWDVTDWPTELGGQLSTSNHIVSDQVSITIDVDVLFTAERKIG